MRSPPPHMGDSRTVERTSTIRAAQRPGLTTGRLTVVVIIAAALIGYGLAHLITMWTPTLSALLVLFLMVISLKPFGPENRA